MPRYKFVLGFRLLKPARLLMSFVSSSNKKDNLMKNEKKSNWFEKKKRINFLSFYHCLSVNRVTQSFQGAHNFKCVLLFDHGPGPPARQLCKVVMPAFY